MNEITLLPLFDFMGGPEGWGREQGRNVYPRLLNFVEENPGPLIFRVSVSKVLRMDISFASETVIQLARRYRGRKGFCFVDLVDPDMVENCAAAAERGSQPIMSWSGGNPVVIGPQPTAGTADAFRFALRQSTTRVTEFAAANPVSITNASNKFKQLWEQGFLLRREQAAESGGVEYVYYRIG